MNILIEWRITRVGQEKLERARKREGSESSLHVWIQLGSICISNPVLTKVSPLKREFIALTYRNFLSSCDTIEIVCDKYYCINHKQTDIIIKTTLWIQETSNGYCGTIFSTPFLNFFTLYMHVFWGCFFYVLVKCVIYTIFISFFPGRFYVFTINLNCC